MNNSLPESDQIFNEDLGLKLLDSYTYWSKNRVLFNVLVGISGLIPTISFNFYSSIFNLFGIIIWGLVANGLYSFGYVIESSIITKTNGSKNLHNSRNVLFWLGTISYMLGSIGFAYFYFLLPVVQD